LDGKLNSHARGIPAAREVEVQEQSETIAPPVRRPARGQLLATTSLVAFAVVAGAATPARAAACNATNNNVLVAAGCTNAGTLPELTFTNSTIGAAVINTGTITPGGFSLINSSLLGGFQDTGTITGGILIDAKSVEVAGIVGLNISNTATFGGGIVNSGTITATNPNPVLGIGIDIGPQNLVSTFTGGISNSGTISAGGTGIFVSKVSQFSGDIGNSGTITSSGGGAITVTAATFTGSLVNSGTLSASTTAVSVNNVTQFSGGISNSGTIGSTNGNGIVLVLNTFGSFGGSIANTGTINANSGIGVLATGVSLFSGGISNSRTINAGQAGIEVGTFNGPLVSTFVGGIVNTGTITATTGDGVLVTGFGIALQLPTFSGGIVNNGTVHGNTTGISLQFVSNFSGGIANGGTITVVSTPGPLVAPGIGVAGVSTFTGGITNSGTISSMSANGAGILVAGIANGLTPVTSFSGGIINSGTINATLFGIDVGAGVITRFDGGITNSGSITAQTGIFLGNAVASFSGAISNSGNITGTAGIAIDVLTAQKAITINQSAGTITGAIQLSSHGDILNISGGAIAGSIVGPGAAGTINFALGANTFIYGAPYSFSGINQVNVSSGTVILNGTNSATNVAVSGGNLQVGDAADPAASLTGTVGVTGGMLSGHGTVIGDVSIGNGGTLAPGGSIGTLTIQGNLVFAAAASYMVEISAVGSSSTRVTGTATLGGTVRITSPTNTYRFNSPYTILTSGGRGGTQFGGLVLPTGMTGSLIYPNANDAQLTLTSNLTQLGGMNVNQRNVARALDAAFNGGGQTGALGGIFSGNVPQNLTQASGETAVGSQQTTFDAMTLFMGVMTDPFIGGRGNTASPASGGMSFASEFDAASAYAAGGRKRSGAERDAYGMITKAVPRLPTVEQRWSVWAAGFGGSQTTNGNGVEQHDQPARRRCGRRRLSCLAEHARWVRACRRRHEFQRRQWRFRALRPVPGRRVHPAQCRRCLPYRRAGLWLAGYRHRSHRHRRGDRPVACRVQRQRIFRPRRRRLPFPYAVDERSRHHALCRRPVHHVRSAGLCRAGSLRHQRICAELCGQDRDGLAQ
jgi:hypothetical protein